MKKSGCWMLERESGIRREGVVFSGTHRCIIDSSWDGIRGRKNKRGGVSKEEHEVREM